MSDSYEATGEPPLWPCGCVMGDPGCACSQPELYAEEEESEQVTDFGVGDRVLAPGVVTAGLGDGVNVRFPNGQTLNFHVSTLRPDTGGRDLTAWDIRDAHHASWGVPQGGFSKFVAEYLNRIARGDAGSAGDEACMWAHPAECPVHGAGDDTAPPAVPDDVARRWLVERDDARRMIVDLQWRLDETQAELIDARSEIAALRPAGERLAESLNDVLAQLPGYMGPTAARSERDAAVEADNAWRSVAGSPTSDGPGWVLPEERAARRRTLADKIRAAGVEGEHPSRGPLVSVAAVLTLLDGEDR